MTASLLNPGDDTLPSAIQTKDRFPKVPRGWQGGTPLLETIMREKGS